jgi:hypothetical protein
VGLLYLSVGDKETRALWHEPDEGHLEDRRKRLHQRWHTPAPVAV